MDLRYQHEKAGDAIAVLMSLTLPAEQRAAAAMRELDLAFASARAPIGVTPHLRKLQALMGSPERYEERARALTREDRQAFVTAVWAIDRAVSRAYYSQGR